MIVHKLAGINKKQIMMSFIAVACIVMVSIVSIACIAVLNPAALYQGIVLVLLPLAFLSLCMSGASTLFCLGIVQDKDAGVEVQMKESPSLNISLEQHSAPVAPTVHAENMVITQPSADQMFLRRALKASKDNGLTQRETEVLELLLQGRNAERISQNLVISRHTAKTHIYNIYKKVGSSSQQELIDLFQERVTEIEKGDQHARSSTRSLRAS